MYILIDLRISLSFLVYVLDAINLACLEPSQSCIARHNLASSPSLSQAARNIEDVGFSSLQPPFKKHKKINSLTQLVNV